jgi:hypothetical protein
MRTVQRHIRIHWVLGSVHDCTKVTAVTSSQLCWSWAAMVTHLNCETSHGYLPLTGLGVDNGLGYWSVWYWLCGFHGLWHEATGQVATIVSKVQTTSIFSVKLTQFGRVSLIYIIGVEKQITVYRNGQLHTRTGQGGPGPDGNEKRRPWKG